MYITAELAAQHRKDGEEIEKQLPPDFDKKKDLYRPHGKFAFAKGERFISVDRGMHLGTGVEASAYLKKGTIAGREITAIVKWWSVWEQWRGFYKELFLYAHPKLLRPLQGICVPYFVNVCNAPGGHVSFIMETPHHVGWRFADLEELTEKNKEDIVEAYTKLHAQGVIHGDVAMRHILIGDDGRVTLIDFGQSTSSLPGFLWGGASPRSFRVEMRQVKFFIDYKGARAMEHARTEKAMVGVGDREDPTPALKNDAGEDYAFSRPTLSDWVKETGPSPTRVTRFEIPVDKRSAPLADKRDYDPLPLGPYPEDIIADAATSTTGSGNDVAVATNPGPPKLRSGVPPAVRAVASAAPVVGPTRKRIREESGPDSRTNGEAPAPRQHALAFHPDTNDNGIWANGRAMKRLRRTPTPFPRDPEHDTDARPPVPSDGLVTQPSTSPAGEQRQIRSATPSLASTANRGTLAPTATPSLKGKERMVAMPPPSHTNMGPPRAAIPSVPRPPPIARPVGSGESSAGPSTIASDGTPHPAGQPQPGVGNVIRDVLPIEVPFYIIFGHGPQSTMLNVSEPLWSNLLGSLMARMQSQGAGLVAQTEAPSVEVQAAMGPRGSGSAAGADRTGEAATSGAPGQNTRDMSPPKGPVGESASPGKRKRDVKTEEEDEGRLAKRVHPSAEVIDVDSL